MTLIPADRDEMVKLEFERAWKMMNEADINLKNELWNVVGNRIYYAVFHGVSGLLIKSGLKVGTHKGASITFAKHFVKTGIFDKKFSSLYGQLQSIREKADYHNTYELDAKDAEELYSEAKEFLNKLQEYAEQTQKIDA